MKIVKVQVRNFRLLKDLVVNLEENLSLVIGKNNSGKTSLLLVLEKFLASGSGKSSFSFNDLSLDLREKLKVSLETHSSLPDGLDSVGISLRLFLEYYSGDSLENIGNKVIMDLDPESNTVVLAFDYILKAKVVERLMSDYRDECKKRVEVNRTVRDVASFLEAKHRSYFQIAKRSLYFDTETGEADEGNFIDLVKEQVAIERIIRFKSISARRGVSNEEKEKSLSSQSARMYKNIESNEQNSEVVETFKEALTQTDEALDKVYDKLFKEVIDDVKKFGGVRDKDSIIKVVSTLQHQLLLDGNTTIKYDLNASDLYLPESYNGLGYMNLISMIFEIKILLKEFSGNELEAPADLNLLVIEEPEAHTHPQMQCIFIKNIKSLLARGISGSRSNSLQTVLTTHSAHIVSESEFEDIRYFKNLGGAVISKNLKDLEQEYETHPQYYKFLKQYLTLQRAELFFADKAIFIEGDTERILLPAIMKKLDQEDYENELKNNVESTLPLLSQNVSVIEVGAYSQVFEKFIDFIGIKSLVITDIDAVKNVVALDDTGEPRINSESEPIMKPVACSVAEGENTSNASLRFFYGKDNDLASFISLDIPSRALSKNPETQKWEHSDDGHLLFVYQINESNDAGEEYHARSFEDSFFHLNRDFFQSAALDENKELIKESFPNLRQQKLEQFISGSLDAWELAQGVIKKPPLAMEILMNSESITKLVEDVTSEEKVEISFDFANWKTPNYIYEGLKWLKAD